MFGDNLITIHQVDYMSTSLIPAEADEDNHDHLVAIRKPFVLKKPYARLQHFVKTLSEELLFNCT